MNPCQFVTTDKPGIYRCSLCGWKMKRPSPHPPEMVMRSCKKGGGARPGDAMKELLAEGGYSPNSCGCNSTAAKMNQLGLDGCRHEIDTLADEVVANAKKQGVEITHEMARWTIEEACRRAEAAAANSA